MKRGTAALVGAGIVLLGIQLVPVDRSNPPVTGEIRAPDDVMSVLERSCWDCHSNETHWPWYAYVAPVSWLVAHDVEEGREHVNFSEWDAYDAGERDEALEEVVEVMEEQEMPLGKYIRLHPDADLSAAERERLIAWARGSGAGEAAAQAPAPER